MLILVKTILFHGIIIMHPKLWSKAQAKEFRIIPSGVYGDDHIGLYLGLASVYMPLDDQ